MNHISEINKLMHIAKLALDLHKARNAAANEKNAYYDVLREFGQGEVTPRLDPADESCAEILAHSADAYKVYKAAKRKVYNAQRRLDTACREVAA